jgi:hypothetical protein
VAYVLTALIGRRPVLEPLLARTAHASLTALAQGLALVPVTSVLGRELAEELVDQPLLVSERMPALLADELAALSLAGDVAYVEVESAGGEPAQAAAVWRDGQLLVGPLIHRQTDAPLPLERMPVNTALRRLGVAVARGSIDEFAAVGLNRHRMTRDWLGLDGDTA